MLDIFVFLVVYVLSVVLISEFVRPRAGGQGVNFCLLLYHYHVLLGFYYGWFAWGTDTHFYWNLGDRFRHFYFESWLDTYGTHNYFVFFLNYPLSKTMGLHFWTGTFIYASVSAWAFVLLYLAGRNLFKNTKISVGTVSLWPGILLLPSLHFWSSGIGKDSLVFLFIAMYFYGIRDLRKYVILVAFSMIGLYHVRPHMAFIVLLSASFMLIIDGKLHFTYKLVFFILAAVGFGSIYDEVLVFLKIDELTTENVEDLFNTSSSNLSYGRSFVDMSGYPYPLKLFTFWYRPLFFDAHNLSSFINSIENAVALFLTLFIFSKVNPIQGYQKSPNGIKIMLLAFLLASIAFAGALSNFGIIVRMKNMTFVYFLFFLIYIYDGHVWKGKINKYRRMKLAQKRRAEIKSRTI